MMICATSPVKQCRVCGDIALGFNFNGLSCESCKAFFRRNAIKNKVFKCRKGGTCQIDKLNRKYCKRCRLEKCYKIGMKKEMILCVKNELLSSSSSSNESSSNDKMTNKNIKTIADDCDDDSDTEMECLSRDLITLQTYDLERIHEVRQAMKVFESNENRMKATTSAQTLVQVTSLQENYVKKAIKFCKCFSSFTSLNPMDQMILLKNSYPEVAAVYISFLYNAQKDGFNALASESGDKAIFVKMDFSAQMKKKEISSIFRRFAMMMNREMENDPAIRDLIIAQLLFKPRKNVSCPEFIRYNNSVYSHLFRRYLEHKYKNAAKAERKFASVMCIMNQITVWSGTITEVYENEIDRTQVPQVLSEIYNLNSDRCRKDGNT